MISKGVGVVDSKFDVRVREVVQQLRTTVLGYLSASSSMGDESDLTVVLSPILATRRDDRDRPSGIAGSYLLSSQSCTAYA